VKKETGRWKDRWKVRDLMADGRCSRAVLEFLSSTDVGRRVLAEAEDDAVSAVSEWRCGSRWRSRERGPRRRAPRGHNCSSPRRTSWRPHGWRRRRAGVSFPLLSPSSLTFALLSFVIHLVRFTSSWDRPRRRAEGALAMSRHCADSGQETDCT